MWPSLKIAIVADLLTMLVIKIEEIAGAAGLPVGL